MIEDHEAAGWYQIFHEQVREPLCREHPRRAIRTLDFCRKKQTKFGLSASAIRRKASSLGRKVEMAMFKRVRLVLVVIRRCWNQVFWPELICLRCLRIHSYWISLLRNFVVLLQWWAITVIFGVRLSFVGCKRHSKFHLRAFYCLILEIDCGYQSFCRRLRAYDAVACSVMEHHHTLSSFLRIVGWCCFYWGSCCLCLCGDSTR